MRPTSNEALAELLREHPPVPDDLARARMEKALIERPREIAAPKKRKGWVPAIAAGVALAAALLLAFVLFGDREPEARVARFERRPASAAVERGTLEVGSTLQTQPGELAELRVDASRIRVAGASRARIAELTPERIGLELDAGSLWIAFHPREPSNNGFRRERMSIETPDARVEVVGTVFRVSVSAGRTEVTVSEGVVRVVPNHGSPMLVHAGEHAETAPSAPPPRIAPTPVVPVESPTEAARDDSSERLGTATRLLRQHRTAQGLAMLRPLTVRPGVSASIRAQAWSLIADTEERERNYEDAAHAYEQVARMGRGSAAHAAIFALARLQDRRLHDREAARASYERYLRQTPNGPLAAQARSALCRLGASEMCGTDP
jgi:ferric-dicitrate binding protein FerR (iron transport regulator)